MLIEDWLGPNELIFIFISFKMNHHFPLKINLCAVIYRSWSAMISCFANIDWCSYSQSMFIVFIQISMMRVIISKGGVIFEFFFCSSLCLHKNDTATHCFIWLFFTLISSHLSVQALISPQMFYKCKFKW